MSTLSPSELIINPDGSIFHLHLRPDEVADTIITVGDMARVDRVARYFDEVYLSKRHREFYTKTGRIGKKELSVISSGIGTDNIDILINEVDALFNIDFDTLSIKKDIRSLNFIRLGTSGSIQADIPVDSLVAGLWSFGMDALGYFYEPAMDEELRAQNDFNNFLKQHAPDLRAYAAKGDETLADILLPNDFRGITVSCAGFYAPQGRHLRAAPRYSKLIRDLGSYRFPASNLRITNFEMETAGIFLLSDILGHRAISINTILANRASRTFTKDAHESVEHMLRTVLPEMEKI